MSVILDAIVAGAAAGSKDVATATVKETYARFKALLDSRLASRSPAHTALAQVENRAGDAGDGELADAGGPWREVLEAELVEAGATDSADLIAAAHELLELLAAQGLPTGPKYGVDASGAMGVQVGDRNTQTNTFGAP